MIKKNVQLLCICSNSEKSIYRTLLSWYSYVGRVCVLINNTTDNTEKEILRACPDAVIFHRKFKGFSNTRNELIKLSEDERYDYNIMIDDSYELVQWQNIPIQADIGAIQICNEQCSYPSARIFKSGQNIHYTGTIHEVIESKNKIKVLLDWFIVYDRIYPEHILRSFKRLDYDLVCLEGLTDDRSVYYRATTLLKLGLTNEALEIIKTIQPSSMYYKIIQLYNK